MLTGSKQMLANTFGLAHCYKRVKLTAYLMPVVDGVSSNSEGTWSAKSRKVRP